MEEEKERKKKPLALRADTTGRQNYGKRGSCSRLYR
jgi:hypothetical protein